MLTERQATQLRKQARIYFKKVRLIQAIFRGWRVRTDYALFAKLKREAFARKKRWEAEAAERAEKEALEEEEARQKQEAAEVLREAEAKELMLAAGLLGDNDDNDGSGDETVDESDSEEVCEASSPFKLYFYFIF